MIIKYEHIINMIIVNAIPDLWSQVGINVLVWVFLIVVHRLSFR